MWWLVPVVAGRIVYSIIGLALEIDEKLSERTNDESKSQTKKEEAVTPKKEDEAVTRNTLRL